MQRFHICDGLDLLRDVADAASTSPQNVTHQRPCEDCRVVVLVAITASTEVGSRSGRIAKWRRLFRESCVYATRCKLQWLKPRASPQDASRGGSHYGPPLRRRRSDQHLLSRFAAHLLDELVHTRSARIARTASAGAAHRSLPQPPLAMRPDVASTKAAVEQRAAVRPVSDSCGHEPGDRPAAPFHGGRRTNQTACMNYTTALFAGLMRAAQAGRAGPPQPKRFTPGSRRCRSRIRSRGSACLCDGLHAQEQSQLRPTRLP